jgi:hypothetical protein
MFDGAPRLPIGDRQLLLAIAIRGESLYSGPVRLIAAICSLAMCCPMTGGSGSSSTGVTDEELGHALDHPVGPPFATRTQWAGPWTVDGARNRAGSPRTRTLMTRVEADRHGVGRRCPQVEREMSALLGQRRPLLFVHVMCEIDLRQGSCDTPTFCQSEPTVVVNLRCSSTRGGVFRPPPAARRPPPVVRSADPTRSGTAALCDSHVLSQ